MKATGLLVGFFLIFGGMTWADENSSGDRETHSMMEKSLSEALKAETKELMSLPGVVGTALGSCDGQPCIKVYVVQRTPELDRKIFNRLAGYPVQIEETGGMQALPENQK